MFNFRWPNLIRRRQRRLIVFTYTLVFVITWFWPRDIWEPAPKETHNSRTQTVVTRIDLVLSLQGNTTVKRMSTMLKSLLYYAIPMIPDVSSQAVSGDRCQLVHSDTLGVICDELKSSRTAPQTGVTTTTTTTEIEIHFHFLTSDDETQSILADQLYSWGWINGRWTMYSINPLTLEWIPNVHRAGIAGLSKLLVSSILPLTVKKAIVLDTDMMFNANILDLWRHFDRFNKEQAFGLAWEQQSEDAHCNHTVTWPIPSYGVNSGIVLLDLDRLRAIGWDQLWRDAVQSFLTRYGVLHQADQDVYNEVIRSYPHLYYKLPCEWNVQLYAEVTQFCCPVWWPDRDWRVGECHQLNVPMIDRAVAASMVSHPTTQMARIIHFDLNPKPGDPDFPWTLPAPMHVKETNMNRVTLIKRFIQAYHKFDSLPSDCFV